jgi:hypothetical protein
MSSILLLPEQAASTLPKINNATMRVMTGGPPWAQLPLWLAIVQCAVSVEASSSTGAGAYVIRRLDAETFRRICMSFDAWVVGFGLSRVLIELDLMESPWAYSVMAVTILIDAYLLYIFFTGQRTGAPGDWSGPDDAFLRT